MLHALAVCRRAVRLDWPDCAHMGFCSDDWRSGLTAGLGRVRVNNLAVEAAGRRLAFFLVGVGWHLRDAFIKPSQKLHKALTRLAYDKLQSRRRIAMQLYSRRIFRTRSISSPYITGGLYTIPKGKGVGRGKGQAADAVSTGVRVVKRATYSEG
jgi:hypothetical protein